MKSDDIHEYNRQTDRQTDRQMDTGRQQVPRLLHSVVR